jgi:limonene-1,2-epoxide hydrolase
MISKSGKTFYGCKHRIPAAARIKRLFVIQVKKINNPLSRTAGISKSRANIRSRGLMCCTNWMGMLRAASAATMSQEDETAAQFIYPSRGFAMTAIIQFRYEYEIR